MKEFYTPIAHNAKPLDRQQLLLRAVVGSLVLCAALGTTLPAVALGATAQTAVCAEASVNLHRHSNLCRACAGKNLTARLHVIRHEQHRALRLAHMTPSANGKRFALQPTMSRAERGNLRRQHQALP
jgi:hypothetical protein